MIKKVFNIIKIIGGCFTSLMAITGLILMLTQEFHGVALFLIIAFAIATFLLFRSAFKKKPNTPVQVAQQPTMPKPAITPITQTKPTYQSKTIPKAVEFSEVQTTPLDPIYSTKLMDGFYPGEIILLYWWSYSIKSINSKLPGYFEYKYNINAQTHTKQLREQGYLEFASGADLLNTLGVAELKEILKQYSLKVSGKKQELIERITGNTSKEDLKTRLTHQAYKATPKARELLNKYKCLTWAHHNGQKTGVSVEDVLKNLDKFLKLDSFEDITDELLQKRFAKSLTNKNFGIATSELQFLANVTQTPTEALWYYLKIFIYDTSGMYNNGMVLPPKSARLDTRLAMIIGRTVASFNLDRDTLNKIFSEIWSDTENELPFHYLDEVGAFLALESFLKLKEDFDLKTLWQRSYNKLPEERKTELFPWDTC